MSSLFAIRALLFAGECFAASVLLLSLAWIASKVLKTASARHFAWLTAFGVLLVLPAVAVIVPAGIAIERKIETREPVPAYVEYAAPAAPDVSAATSSETAPEPAPLLTSAPASPPWYTETRNIAIALFAVWLAGFVYAMMRLATAMLGLELLRRRSRPHALASEDLPSVAMAGRECELRLSLREDGPMAWGFFQPVILLPKNSLTWPRARLQAVLLHELAHIRRRDCLTQMLSLVACAVYWPNPLMWIGARALRCEAEISADDAVIASGVKQSAYAGELVLLASEFRGRRALTGVAMAAPTSLEARVKSVLAPNTLRKGVTFMDALKVALLGAAATAALAFVRPDVVEAQDVAAPPPAPVAAPAELPPPPDAVATVPDVLAPPAPPAPRHHHAHAMQSAQADVPAAPAAPPAPAALPAPSPMPAAAPLPPAPPVAANDMVDDEDANNDIDIDSDDGDATINVSGDKVVSVRKWRDKDGHVHVSRSVRLTPADRAEIARAQHEVKRAMVEVRRIQPEVEKALAAAKVDEKVARAMREVEPRIRAEIDRAMAEAKPEIRRAIAEAHISEKVMKAIHDAQPKIDAAMRRMDEAQRRIEIKRIERDSDDEAPSAAEDGDGNGAEH
jgi:beta-lactamase regulating signal transducer with metallopeptidase domain